jgi:hypothetical protein
MADLEHKDVTDPNIHETKGMAAAVNGQVHAKAAGVGAWVDPTSLVTTRHTTVFTGSTLTNQIPVGLDTPLGVTFGGAVVGTDVSIDGAGVITVNTDGYYLFKFNLSFGRTSVAGTAILLARLLVNGVATGFVQGCKMADDEGSNVAQFDIEFAVTAGTTIAVQVMQDSAGIANGGLIGLASVSPSWGDVPSAWCRITKFVGTDD